MFSSQSEHNINKIGFMILIKSLKISGEIFQKGEELVFLMKTKKSKIFEIGNEF